MDQNLESLKEAADLICSEPPDFLKGAVDQGLDEAEAIQYFANAPDLEIRSRLAKYPDLPLPVLLRLSEDPNREVRCDAAANPSLPEDTLAQLAHDRSWEVRSVVAGSERARVDTLEYLAEDRNNIVRNAVARNPRTGVDAWRKLLGDKDESVAAWAWHHLEESGKIPVRRRA